MESYRDGRKAYYATLEGVNDRLGAIIQLQFIQDAANVVANGARAELQMSGDVLIRQALGQQLQDLSFTIGEERGRRHGVSFVTCHRNSRVYVGVPIMCKVYGFEQLLR